MMQALSVDWQKSLRDLLGDRVQFNAETAELTSLRAGGPATAVCFPKDEAELTAIVKWTQQHSTPYEFVGKGTNLLVRDGGYNGLLICTNQGLQSYQFEEKSDQTTWLTAAAGVSMAILIRECETRGLTGLESLTGVPGSVGGAVRMNAGTLAGSLADSLVSARLLLADGSVEERSLQELRMSYRHANIPAGSAVLSATIQLKGDTPENVRARVKQVRGMRQNQPLQFPSAGSIFKNPKGDSAGRILDSLGFKGKRRGEAMISETHANWVINLGNASSNDILGLIESAQQMAQEKCQIDLQLELRVIGCNAN